ncbi:probable LRR receptor-like serine/threonine-protein kinase At1g63430 isoform X2 [Cucurbita pepo subsp. pepo]|uniref:probable LRR receptor-like serine/threonine-protein kinase At1g63430 isoform X1 n=1 Tax=Cucurbita pepo subsp. pepo TaxID=3664 RepID=UPI000C9D93A8|nr:probable LRR receptor-like serine/threonine-protein kinase At1g63430 isoform X1 [Cucurbita pepo subsp. pepo]XP_023520764.1 probable LRR receptor-like serine/threonine-protein kinase At1g63430 isoform X2 [Cucurbita pepo subsp. pepo]
MGHFASVHIFCLISAVLIVTSDSFASNEASALKTFKEQIYEDPKRIFVSWNLQAENPCNWSGIACSPDGGHVIKLDISGALLKGSLAPSLGQLSFLQELYLHGNNLLGTIPKELGLLKKLKVLDLGTNQLSGPIPSEIGSLTDVLKINLGSNGLTGRIPPELGKLRYLRELRLDRNKLQGPIPGGDNSAYTSNMHRMYASNPTGFCHSTELKFADFSYNFFVGKIPKCLDYLPRSSFRGNCLQYNDPKQRTAAQCGGVAPPARSHSGGNSKHIPVQHDSKHQKTSKPSWLLTLKIITGVTTGSLFIVALITSLRKCNGKSSIIIPWKKSSSGKDHVTLYIDTEMLKDVPSISRQDLEVACEDFSNIIGSSPDSLVYKGTMKGGPEIAVISICIKEENWTDYLELYFQREVADLARLNHENVGKLLGYCKESSPFTRMLVFEYASNGTLYEHLHYGEGCLSWTRRMNIILGIARGLKYLHSELQPPFTISELNSGAVYLTDDFSPKLVDFESWKTILSRSEKNSGSIGSQVNQCILPNSLEPRHLDIESNIYAFGILLLEVVSGRPPYCKDKECLVDWAKEFLGSPDAMSCLVDPEVKHFADEDLRAICEVVNLCIHPQPAMLVCMKDLCNMLETRIDTTVSVELKASSLAWAELALSS